MFGAHGCRAQRGQAAPEYVGVVLVVAILLVGAALLVRSHVPTGSHPPIVPSVPRAVEHVTDPLEDLGAPATTRPGWLRRTIGRVRQSGRMVALGGAAFGRGFGQAVMRDLEALATDPAAVLRGGGDLAAALRDPVGAARVLAVDLRDYVRTLRRMEPEAAYRCLMEDLGGLSEDVLVARGRTFVLRRLARVARDGARRGPGRTTRP